MKCPRPRLSTRILLLLLSLSGLLNLAAWCSAAFSNWYADCVFPLVTAPLAHLTSLLPFSLGEWLLPAAVIWIVLFALTLLLLWCLRLRELLRSGAQRSPGAGAQPADVPESSPARQISSAPGEAACFPHSPGGSPAGTTAPAAGRLAGAFRAFGRRFTRATCWMLALVLLLMTLNCFILYHVTPLEESLPGCGKEYSIEELGELRDFIVEQCNTLAPEMPRDENGEVIYEGGLSSMAQTGREAIAGLAELTWPASGGDTGDAGAGGDTGAGPEDNTGGGDVIFARLSGWSPTAKGLFFSDFVSQQYIQGYYFPFTMEANINTIMKTTNQPATICHELSHTHGFIYEDEANLIGFLACIYSDDPVFQYSGWLSVLNYVNNSFYDNVETAVYRSHTAISDLVKWDNQFLSDEAWEEVEEDALLSTETVKAATDVYLDTTLKVNGVGSGKASYSHVVELLLMYFDGSFEVP